MNSPKIKNVALNLHNKGYSYREIASILDISKSIVHYWTNYKYTPITKVCIDVNKIIKFIKSLLISDKFISLLNIRSQLLLKFKKSFSSSFIYTIIVKKLNYSYKKISKKTYSKNIKELLKLKKKFIRSNKNYSNIISIDETYVHSNIHNNYGWSLKGKPLIHFVKSNPIKYTIIVAISCNGNEHYTILNKNANTDSYKEFITQLSLKFSNKKFLMDNVSFHKSSIIKNIIENSSNEILFIPPYSPELNPIEEVFSLLKRKIINSDSNTILSKIKNSIISLKNTNFENYYKHSFQK